ncbi:MAG: hypothetical protein EAX89_11900 [Candidatus Lokiarchaeota archaeon]|nr:hypothetical protein [Candidatus Lokiarchaeota archaeon]
MDKKVEYVPFVGTVEDYLCRSPWDFYSWGHIALGIASFSLLSLMITITEALIGPAIIAWWFILLLTFSVGVIWEILENTVILWWGWRPHNRRDTFVNAFWDIIFVTCGGAFTWLLKWIIKDLISLAGRYFYITALTFFVLVMVAYFIGFYITNKNTKKAREEHHKIIS